MAMIAPLSTSPPVWAATPRLDAEVVATTADDVDELVLAFVVVAGLVEVVVVTTGAFSVGFRVVEIPVGLVEVAVGFVEVEVGFVVGFVEVEVGFVVGFVEVEVGLVVGFVEVEVGLVVVEVVHLILNCIVFSTILFCDTSRVYFPSVEGLGVMMTVSLVVKSPKLPSTTVPAAFLMTNVSWTCWVMVSGMLTVTGEHLTIG
jgi:hypothetical protein